MSFIMSRCTPDDDWTHLFTIVADAFGLEHPYFDFLFPSHTTSEGRKNGGVRLKQEFESNPRANFFKMTVTKSGPDQGKVVGIAKWLIFDDGVVPERGELTGNWWASEEDKELAAYTAGKYTDPRWDAIRASKGHLVCMRVSISPRSYLLMIPHSLGPDGRGSGLSQTGGWKNSTLVGPLQSKHQERGGK